MKLIRLSLVQPPKDDTWLCSTPLLAHHHERGATTMKDSEPYFDQLDNHHFVGPATENGTALEGTSKGCARRGCRREA